MMGFGMQWHQLLHMQTICTSFQIHITAVSKDIFNFLLNPYFCAILSENLNGKNDWEPALYQLVRKWNRFVQILRRSCWHIPGFHWVTTNSSCFLVPYNAKLTPAFCPETTTRYFLANLPSQMLGSALEH